VALQSDCRAQFDQREMNRLCRTRRPNVPTKGGSGVCHNGFGGAVGAQRFAQVYVLHPIGVEEHGFGAEGDICILQGRRGAGPVIDIPTNHDGKRCGFPGKLGDIGISAEGLVLKIIGGNGNGIQRVLGKERDNPLLIFYS